MIVGSLILSNDKNRNASKTAYNMSSSANYCDGRGVYRSIANHAIRSQQEVMDREGERAVLDRESRIDSNHLTLVNESSPVQGEANMNDGNPIPGTETRKRNRIANLGKYFKGKRLVQAGH